MLKVKERQVCGFVGVLSAWGSKVRLNRVCMLSAQRCLTKGVVAGYECTNCTAR